VVSTFGVPELQLSTTDIPDFTSDFEDLVIPYITNKYSLTDPAKTDTDHFSIHVGFYDYFRPYEITALTTDTRVEEWLNGGRASYQSTGLEISIRMKRINRNKVDPQLGNMEREIIRIAGQYRHDDILGIKNILYDGGGRVYQATDDYSKSDWRCVVRVRVYYEKRDIS